MTTPFHDIAGQLRAIADELEAQGDAVALGNFTVGLPPEQAQEQADATGIPPGQQGVAPQDAPETEAESREKGGQPDREGLGPVGGAKGKTGTTGTGV